MRLAAFENAMLAASVLVAVAVVWWAIKILAA
jgi:hypothetical protein